MQSETEAAEPRSASLVFTRYRLGQAQPTRNEILVMNSRPKLC